MRGPIRYAIPYRTVYITHPWSGFSKLDCSTTKRVPQYRTIRTSSASSRRDFSDADHFGTDTTRIQTVEILTMDNRLGVQVYRHINTYFVPVQNITYGIYKKRKVNPPTHSPFFASSAVEGASQQNSTERSRRGVGMPNWPYVCATKKKSQRKRSAGENGVDRDRHPRSRAAFAQKIVERTKKKKKKTRVD